MKNDIETLLCAVVCFMAGGIGQALAVKASKRGDDVLEGVCKGIGRLSNLMGTLGIVVPILTATIKKLEVVKPKED